MMSWRYAKGLVNEFHYCERCSGDYPVDEFDFEEDCCLFCLFPEVSKSMPVPIVKDDGIARNITNTRTLLDNLDYIPEKQSEKAVKNHSLFKEGKVSPRKKVKKRKAYK